MKIAKGIKFINVNNMKYIYCFLLFIVSNAYLRSQINSNTTESDLFYKEDDTEKKEDIKSNIRVLQQKNNTKSNFNDFINSQKPFFLTGKSLSPLKKTSYYNNEDFELFYNYIYEYEKYSNELQFVSLNNKAILYFSRVINDSIIEAKSNSKSYFIYKKALDINQINNEPIELDDEYLKPVILYFSNFSNNSNIRNSIKCYVETKFKDYDWKSEFDKEDYVILVTQKILNNIKINNKLNTDSYYKDYTAVFGNYNFENNIYDVNFSGIIGSSDFFNNDFENRIEYKSIYGYTKNAENNLEVKCNPSIAREIATLFDSERKINIRMELIPLYNSTLCNCSSCYENKFSIKSLIISRDTNFNESNFVRIYF
jgi:hypothetical protein